MGVPLLSIVVSCKNTNKCIEEGKNYHTKHWMHPIEGASAFNGLVT